MSCITQSLGYNLKSPLAVVAHDAGAANLISGWLKDVESVQVHFSVGGPALGIFACEYPNFKNMGLIEAFDGAASLLSGTSSHLTNIEHEARVLARKRGVPSIGVIDHWVNYTERFVRNEHQVLPDEIWVSDEFALTIAQNCFPAHPVRQLPNRYLEQLIEKITVGSQRRTDGKVRVLYVLEPIRERWDSSDIPGEFQALDFFVGKLDMLGLNDNAEFRMRPHPSDPAGKYNEWCDANIHRNFSVDSTNSLSDLIAWSDWVVGCETFAMVIALHANKQVLSTLPPWAPPCKLPQKKIVKLREL